MGFIFFRKTSIVLAVVMLLQILGVSMSFASQFADLEGHWAKTNIEAMVALGLVNGVDDTTFAPDRQITRAEFATLLVRTLELQEQNPSTNTFADVTSVDWFFKAVETAVAAKLVSGKGDGLFIPQGNITRQEMAVMIQRALVLKGINLDVQNTETYTDEADFAPWATEAINVVTVLKIITGNGDGAFSPNSNATRAQAVVVLHRIYSLMGLLLRPAN
ncbi:MAG: S-layer homology domain-containing protein [Hyphomonadaceae bacterium]|nr:S-layer homology domain-containing protein [Clostridia bacterium]